MKAVWEAAASGDTAKLSALIARQHPRALAPEPASRMTPLHIAANAGQPRTVQILLRAALADATAVDAHGQTPLHHAAFGGNVNVVVLLLQRSPHLIDLPDALGRTPAFLARVRNHNEVLDCLVRAGAHEPTPWPAPPSMLDFASYWMPDACASRCMTCAVTGFNVKNRRHHCRNCGKVICKPCSAQVTGLDAETPTRRVCKLCWPSCNAAVSAALAGPFLRKAPQSPRTPFSPTSSASSPASPATSAAAVLAAARRTEEMRRALQACSFFFPDMARAEAETLLTHDNFVAEKTFLLRASSQPDHVALSVCTDGDVRHFLVAYNQGCWAVLMDQHPLHPKPVIDELVAFHQQDRPGTPAILGAPMTHARAAMIRAARANAPPTPKCTAKPPGTRGHCGKCNAVLTPDAIFCSHCGAHCTEGADADAARDEQVTLDDRESSGSESEGGEAEGQGQGGDGEGNTPENGDVAVKDERVPPSRPPVLATTEDILRHLQLTRAGAERLLMLKKTPVGTFLVRNSSNANNVAVSIRLPDRVKHLRVVLKAADKAGESQYVALSEARSGQHVYTSQPLQDKHIMRQLLATVHARQKNTRMWGAEMLQPCPSAKELVFQCNCGKDCPANAATCPRCGCCTTVERPPVDEWEVPRDHVQLGPMLGHGEFGDVFQGTIRHGHAIATKVLKDAHNRTGAFLHEMQMLKKITGCDNVTNLLGVVTLGDPMLLVLEMVERGDLLSYLTKDDYWLPVVMTPETCGMLSHSYGPDFDNVALTQQTHFRMLRIALDICKGMEHIHSRGVLHLDLAARNCLVDSAERVKVCDFGHACSIENASESEHRPTKIAMRWSSPEMIQSRDISYGTDVWSYGVLLSEVFTRGAEPYADITDNKKLSRKILGDYRMPRPPGVPLEIYQTMMAAWHAEPEKRPSFATTRATVLQPLVDVGPRLVLTG